MLANSSRAITLLVLACLGLLLPATFPALAAAPPDTNLVLGDTYTISAERSTTRVQFQGHLVKANERWVVLCCHENPKERSWFGFSKVGFTQHAEDENEFQSGEHVWIPREIATIKQHKPAAQRTAVKPIAEEAPPTHVACSVQLARRNKLVLLHGGMEEFSSERLVMAVPREVQSTDKSVLGLPAIAGTGISKRTELRCDLHRVEQREVLAIQVSELTRACVH